MAMNNLKPCYQLQSVEFAAESLGTDILGIGKAEGRKYWFWKRKLKKLGRSFGMTEAYQISR